MPRFLPCVLALLSVLATPAWAQETSQETAQETPQEAPREPTPAERATALADSYQLTNADGDRVCPIAIGDKPRKGSATFEVSFDKASCAATILFSADIAAWAPGPGDSIRFSSPDGKLVAEFTEGIGGTWEALREGDGVYFLVNPRLADPAIRPADLAGAWDLAQTPGTPICRVELTDTPEGSDTFRLTLGNVCAASVVALAPDRWRLDGGDLWLLTAKGEGLRFARQEDGSWEKVPPGDGEPLVLTRP